MSRNQTSLGVYTYHGPRDYDAGFGYTIQTYGRLKVLEYVYDYTNLPDNSSDDALVPVIKANSLILDGYHQTIDAFTVGSTDTVNFGLEQPDGTVIDADGLDATVDLEAQSAGDWTVFDGALIGASVGAEDAQVAVTTSAGADITAGKGVIVIRFFEDYSAGL